MHGLYMVLVHQGEIDDLPSGLFGCSYCKYL